MKGINHQSTGVSVWAARTPPTATGTIEAGKENARTACNQTATVPFDVVTSSAMYISEKCQYLSRWLR